MDNPYLFTGRRLDNESSLLQYRRRYHSPTLGRFISRDPAGYADGYAVYEYARSNPTRHLDPSGTYITWTGGLGVAWWNCCPSDPPEAYDMKLKCCRKTKGRYKVWDRKTPGSPWGSWTVMAVYAEESNLFVSHWWKRRAATYAPRSHHEVKDYADFVNVVNSEPCECVGDLYVIGHAAVDKQEKGKKGDQPVFNLAYQQLGEDEEYNPAKHLLSLEGICDSLCSGAHILLEGCGIGAQNNGHYRNNMLFDSCPGKNLILSACAGDVNVRTGKCTTRGYQTFRQE